MAQPLRRQLAVITAILMVLVSIAIAYGARLTDDEHVRQLSDETRLKAASVYVNQKLATADAVASTASRHPTVQALNPIAAQEVLAPLVEPGGLLHNALLADVEGRPVGWARPADPKVESRLDPAWLKTIATTGRTLVSGMLGEVGDTAHAIVLGYPIVSEGKVVGALGLSVHLEAFERVLASLPLPEGSVVTLTDHRSVVVARSLEAAQYVGRPAAPEGRAGNPFDVPSSAILTGIDGVERVFGNAVVERGPWLASVGIPTAAAVQRTLPTYQRNFGISIVTTILILALAWMFGRIWLNTFDPLGDTTRRVSRGDLSPPQPQPMPFAERDRLAAIGVLVSGVAHELNNPLQAILGFAELLQMQPGMLEQAKADLLLIQKQATRVSAIIRNLSRFGRQRSQPTAVRLRDVVASVMQLRQRKLEEVSISVEIDERSQGFVLAIFTELQQVALNFATNAEQAIVHAGSVVRNTTIRPGDWDGWAWIEVEDSGPNRLPARIVRSRRRVLLRTADRESRPAPA